MLKYVLFEASCTSEEIAVDIVAIPELIGKVYVDMLQELKPTTDGETIKRVGLAVSVLPRPCEAI